MCAKYSPQHFTYMNSFNPHNLPTKQMWKLSPEHLRFSSLEPNARIHVILDVSQKRALGHFLPLPTTSFQNLLLSSLPSTHPGTFTALGLPIYLAYYDSSIPRAQTCHLQRCFWLVDK